MFSDRSQSAFLEMKLFSRIYRSFGSATDGKLTENLVNSEFVPNFKHVDQPARIMRDFHESVDVLVED
jgi:hypothetical protein